MMRLGSLFDGSGGFPLAAQRVGITPVWASEVEPFPILVTTTRLPHVQHLGDVAAIDGARVAPVDVVTFGSPCTDLSVAGKQAGLAGEASGLFFQATRLIREMREASNGRYPRFAVWENVPGAFSSNKGHDFARVLTDLIRITNPGAPDVPIPDKGWEPAGVLVGNGCSVAWRVLDAQYFGLAQRRRRIFLVADFASQRAGEILFEPARLSRDSEPGQAAEQNDPNTITGRVGGDSQDGGLTGGLLVYGLNSIHQSRSGGGHYGYEATVSKTLDVKGGEPTCNQGGMIILDPVFAASKSDFFTRATPEQTASLLASDYTAPPMVATTGLRPRRLTPVECARLQGFPDDWCDGLAIPKPTDAQLEYWMGVWAAWNRLRGVRPRSVGQVRAWLADPAGDRAQYKLWGNGVALPVVTFVLDRLKTHAESSPELASVTG